MPKHHIVGAAALLLATAPAAWAEIDAQTIWSDWQDMAPRFGGTLAAASEDYSGGTLTLTDVTMASSIGDADSAVTYGTIRMVEQDDGTVRIEVPQTITTTTSSEVEGTTIEQTIEMTNEGLSIVASEDGGVRTYDMAMDSLTTVVATDVPDSAEPLEVTVGFTGLASVYRSGLDGNPDAFDQTVEGDGMTLSFASAMTDGSVDVAYALTGITSALAGSYGDAPTGPIVGLSDMGIAYGGDISHAGGTLSITGESEQGPFSINSTSDSGKLTLDLSEEALGYTIASTGTKATVETSQFPVPVSFSMAESVTGFTLPMGETGVEKPFAMTVAARELVVDDALWGLFDPTGQLPRDPANLVIDMEGTAVMNVDLFGDPEAMAALQGAPGDLKSLTINQILLTLAGAELRGSGDLDFPEVTAVPEPVGTIELALDGGFALADKLVALGFIPAEQAAFVKGMAGAVAKPVGDDQLESTIEFTPGGGISANGMPLK